MGSGGFGGGEEVLGLFGDEEFVGEFCEGGELFGAGFSAFGGHVGALVPVEDGAGHVKVVDFGEVGEKGGEGGHGISKW